MNCKLQFRADEAHIELNASQRTVLGIFRSVPSKSIETLLNKTCCGIKQLHCCGEL